MRVLVMAVWNPYREYDRGMDDAYLGKEPFSRNSKYQEGYFRSLELSENEMQQKQYDAQYESYMKKLEDDYYKSIEDKYYQELEQQQQSPKLPYPKNEK